MWWHFSELMAGPQVIITYVATNSQILISCTFIRLHSEYTTTAPNIFCFSYRTNLWRGDWLGREKQEWTDERRFLRYVYAPPSFIICNIGHQTAQRSGVRAQLARLVSWFTNSKYSSLHSYLNFVSPGSLHSVCHVSDAVSGSASQSSSANDISSMSTEQTLASDTDSSSIDTLTGPLDESQWTQSMATWFPPPIYNIQTSINHHLPFFSLVPHPPHFLNFFCPLFVMCFFPL